jgi:hypothetical protein
MQLWFQFYSVIGGAAAALLGLLFVAVSINANAVLNQVHGDSRRLAEQAFQNYITVLSVSLVALFPSLTLSEFSFLTLGLTVISGIWALVRLYWALVQRNHDGSRRLSLGRQVLSLIGFGMLIFAALHMALHRGSSLNLLAGSTIVLLVAATKASWELLIRVAGEKQTGPAG